MAAGGRSVDLVVPVKPLRVAKSRLRGAFGEDPAQHARLVLALALDTIGAVLAARRVGRLLVMSTDPVVAAGLAAQRVPVVPDGPVPGLNAALEHGAGLLRAGGAAAVGALQADLPALRPGDLDAAIGQALAAFAAGRGTRAFCADAAGTGTTMLVAAPGVALDPRFGRGSAERHRRSGAVELTGARPGLRCDVDTGEDLRRAAELGLGRHTRGLLAPTARPDLPRLPDPTPLRVHPDVPEGSGARTRAVGDNRGRG
ncbi:MAG TPA: 2-phospho-L-lactate guanylyltransferase [Pseudonocardia sp.]|nr:2-phospho-L-lactate guanylyltransferase [Pseudonocardia sp.]